MHGTVATYQKQNDYFGSLQAWEELMPWMRSARC